MISAIDPVCLGSLCGVNMNATKDQLIVARAGGAKYILRRVVVTNASVSLTTAAGGIYTSTGKGGIALVSGIQVFSALTSPDKYLDIVPSVGASVLTGNQVYLTLTTVQGSQATADVYMFGDILQ